MRLVARRTEPATTGPIQKRRQAHVCKPETLGTRGLRPAFPWANAHAGVGRRTTRFVGPASRAVSLCAGNTTDVVSVPAGLRGVQACPPRRERHTPAKVSGALVPPCRTATLRPTARCPTRDAPRRAGMAWAGARSLQPGSDRAPAQGDPLRENNLQPGSARDRGSRWSLRFAKNSAPAARQGGRRKGGLPLAGRLSPRFGDDFGGAGGLSYQQFSF